ncbi:MAG: V-type ATP synthase subunit E [Anaerolineae bacterium]|nr:V-type ATP synthase subunit E [Anaerolineae bacterium]
MSLQAVLDAIRESGEAQVRAIEADAQTQTHEILHAAQTEAIHLREDTRLSALAPAARDQFRVAQQAQHQALQIVVGAREALVDTAIQRTQERLATLRTDPAYPAILSHLVDEALTDLRQSLTDDSRICLEADPRDRALLEPLLREAHLEARYTLNTWGGVIVGSDDGRITVFNTLESRLERAMPYLRRCLAAQVSMTGQLEVSADPRAASAGT